MTDDEIRMIAFLNYKILSKKFDRVNLEIVRISLSLQMQKGCVGEASRWRIDIALDQLYEYIRW